MTEEEIKKIIEAFEADFKTRLEKMVKDFDDPEVFAEIVTAIPKMVLTGRHHRFLVSTPRALELWDAWVDDGCLHVVKRGFAKDRPSAGS